MPNGSASTTCTQWQLENIWNGWTAATNCTSNNLIWTQWAHSAAANTTNTASRIEWARDEATEERAAAARQRAKEILERHLTEEQRAQLARDRFFVVRSSGGKSYRVRHGRAGNVDLLDEHGKPVEKLCAHPAIWCPDEDTMLAQKLALETDEETFRRIANITRVAA